MAQVTHRNSLTSKVLKALSLFTGIECLNMLCAVVRTKLIALWIGTAGVGIISLLNSNLELLRSILFLNLNQSAVQKIASAKGNDQSIAISATSFLGIALGVVAAIIVAACSPLLSIWVFGHDSYTWAFAILAVTMCTGAISSARTAILRSTNRLRQLARATLFASITSTAAAIPLIYFWRMQAIVPVLIIFAISQMVFLLLPSLHIPKCKFSTLQPHLKPILKLGLGITVAMSAPLLADQLIRIYIHTHAGIEAVGIFQAGYTIVNTYIGVIFTAISMEYYPRLSSVARSQLKARTVVAHEISVVLWILLPIVILFLSADSLVVSILFSEQFHQSLPYISMAIAGTALRAASWCMAYMILARGDSLAYIFTEISSAAVLFVASIVCFNQWSYAGLGIAYSIQFLAYTLLTAAVCRYRYRLHLPRRIWSLILLTTATVIAAIAAKAYIAWWTPLLLLPAILPATLHHLNPRRGAPHKP